MRCQAFTKHPWSHTFAVLLLAAASLQAQSLEEFDADYLETGPQKPELAEVEEQIVARTNAFRREHGLEPLATDARLVDAARYFAAYMARTGDYGHRADENRPSQRAALYDYDYCIVAENIAWAVNTAGFGLEELVDKFVTGWQQSPGHRENMLNPHVTETGVAVAHNPESGKYYAVQMFGRPESARVKFRLANRTDQTLNYVVRSQGIDEESGRARQFELPPSMIRTHLRCRPAELVWKWAEEQVPTKVSGGKTFVIREEGGKITVETEPIHEEQSR